MTGHERIHATLAGAPIDRRAVIPALSLYGAKRAGCSTEHYYSEPEAYVRGQSAVIRDFSPDVILGPFAFALLGGAFGSQLVWLPNNAPGMRHAVLCSLEQWNQLVWPTGTHPRLRYFTESLQGLRDAAGGNALIASCLPLPTDLPPLILGMNLWMETLLFDPKGVRKIMDRVIPFFLELAHDHLAAGADLIVGSSTFASPSILPRDLVVERVCPYLEEALSRLKAPLIIHHGGSPLSGHLDLLAGLPSVCGLALDERDSVLEARCAIGPAATLLVGPYGPRLSELSAEEVEALCQSKLNEAGKDPRIILCTSGPDIPLETRAENILAMVRAASFAGSQP